MFTDDRQNFLKFGLNHPFHKFRTYDQLRGVEWIHRLFLFPLVLGKM